MLTFRFKWHVNVTPARTHAAGALGPGSQATSKDTQIGSLSLRLAFQPAAVSSPGARVHPPHSAAAAPADSPAANPSDQPPHRNTRTEHPAADPATQSLPRLPRAAPPAPDVLPAHRSLSHQQSTMHEPVASATPSPVLPPSWAPPGCGSALAETGRHSASLEPPQPAPFAARVLTPTAPPAGALTPSLPARAPHAYGHTQHMTAASPLYSLREPGQADAAAAATQGAHAETHGARQGGAAVCHGTTAAAGSSAVAVSELEHHSHSLDAWRGAAGGGVRRVEQETARERAAREAAQWRQEQEAAAEAELAAAGVQRRSILETEWRGQHARRAAEQQECLGKLADAENSMARVRAGRTRCRGAPAATRSSGASHGVGVCVWHKHRRPRELVRLPRCGTGGSVRRLRGGDCSAGMRGRGTRMCSCHYCYGRPSVFTGCRLPLHACGRR